MENNQKAGNIRVIHIEEKFLKVSKDIICNKEIDPFTLGIYVKILSFGDMKNKNFNLNILGLSAMLNISGTKIRRAFALLEKAGYLSRERVRDENKRIIGWSYSVYPIPISEMPKNQHAENANVGESQMLENGVVYNRDSNQLETETINRDGSITPEEDLSLFGDSVPTADGVAAASHQSNKPNKHYIDQRRVKVPPSGDIETRDAQFKAWCFEYLGEFDEGLITDLYLKYSQPDRQGKLLFELEKSWDMHKRLLYWKRCREKGFNRYPKNNAQAVEPEHKEISAQEALKRAGWI